MNLLPNFLRPKVQPQKVTVLDAEANILLVEKLKKPEGGLVLGGYGGKVVAMRLIDTAAKQRFGTTVTDVPLTQKELQTLLEEGLLDLSEAHLTQVYEGNRVGKKKENTF